MCEFTGATPAAPHTLTMGIQSTPFPIDKGGIYAWSAWVYTETDANEGAVYGNTAKGPPYVWAIGGAYLIALCCRRRRRRFRRFCRRFCRHATVTRYATL